MKRTHTLMAALFLLAAASPPAAAINDLILRVDDGGAGICIAADTLNNTACGGETLVVDGTRDSLLYFVPETGVRANDTLAAKFEYAVRTPLGLIVSLLFVILCVGLTVAALKMVAYLAGGIGRG